MDSTTRIPLWLDCDPGHDDAAAILLAAHHPKLQLLGISTTHGNAPLSNTTYNALSVLQSIGKDSISVIPGATHPFCRSVHPASDIHGESGLEGTALLPKPARKSLSHCNAIIEMHAYLSACAPNTAWLVATGPCTNIAILFSTFPSLASHIAGLAIMGGAIGSYTGARMGPAYTDAAGLSHDRVGNVTPFAEFNIWADPEAAQSIFMNPILASKTTLIPLDLTHQALVDNTVQAKLLHGAQGATRLRTMFNELMVFFAKTYEQVFGIHEGPPLHDPLAVAVVLWQSQGLDEPSKIAFDDRSGERWTVSVVLEGEQIGRTVATPSKNGAGVIVPRSLDLDKFWEVLEMCMALADKATGYEMPPVGA